MKRALQTNPSRVHKTTTLEVISKLLALSFFGLIFGGLYWLSQQDALQYYQDHIVHEGRYSLVFFIFDFV